MFWQLIAAFFSGVVAATVSQSTPYRVIWLNLQTIQRKFFIALGSNSSSLDWHTESTQLNHLHAPPRVAVQLDLLLVRSICAAEYDYAWVYTGLI